MNNTIHSLQAWPRGISYQYIGDASGPADQRALKTSDDQGYRAGTAAEWREIRIAKRAEMYERNLIHVNQTSLIDELIREQREGFTTDDIRNLTTNAETMDAAECRDWLTERGIDLPDLPTHSCGNCDGEGTKGDAKCDECKGSGEVPDPDADENDKYSQELRDAVNDHAEQVEILQWFLVDSWLCGQLDAIGEPTIDNDYGFWWGRTCCGQELIMDGTLQRIAAHFEGE